MASPSNKSFKISFQLRPMAIVADGKECSFIPKIKIKDISPRLREYAAKCAKHPHLTGRKSEVSMLQNILGRYQDPDDILSDNDFDMLVLIMQCVKEKAPPKGMEKLNDWLFSQLTIDLNLSSYINDSLLF